MKGVSEMNWADVMKVGQLKREAYLTAQKSKDPRILEEEPRVLLADGLVELANIYGKPIRVEEHIYDKSKAFHLTTVIDEVTYVQVVFGEKE